MLGESEQLCCVHEYEKTYWVMVEDEPTQEKLVRLAQGVQLKDYLTQPAKAGILSDPNLPSCSKPVTSHGPTAWIEIELREGKKRQIRHMTAAVGLPTLRLVRVAIGHIRLGDLSVGEWRELTRKELSVFR